MAPKLEVNRRFICSFPDCSAAYDKQWKLDAHLCKHTGVRPFPCTWSGCAKSFCDPYHLAQHDLTHIGARPFRCDVDDCGEVFSTKSNMKRHVTRIHAQDKKKYVCKIEGCGLDFKKHKLLKTHMCEQHTQIPPYACTFEGCQMRFAVPSKLKRHEKVHQGYPCTEENCTFTGKTWTEILKHKKESHKRVFECEQCCKTFRDSWFLKQHQLVHKETRVVYKCPRNDCSRSFVTMFNLQSHIRSFHDDVRPFACTHPGCEKTFSMKQSLLRHTIVHDPERKKLRKPRPKRSLASRLSGYCEKKSGVSRKTNVPKSSPEQKDRGSPVELVSLLQGTVLCSSTAAPQDLSEKLTAPLAI